jgi:hypothetical protein
MWIDFAGQFQKSLTALPLKTYQAGARECGPDLTRPVPVIQRSGPTFLQ